MRRSLAVLMVGAALFLVGVAPAFAVVTSTVSIAYNATTHHFHGKVSSANAECRSGRTVRVFKKTASGPKLVGKTLSTAKGTWRLRVNHAHGHYFARIPRQKIM